MSVQIVIRGGKFYRGNVEVKPKFGDLEQINAIKAHEEKMRSGICDAQLQEEEITKYYPIVKFSCPFCNEPNNHSFEDDAEDEHVWNFDVDQAEIECTSCEKEFIVHADKTKTSKMAIYLSFDNMESQENQ